MHKYYNFLLQRHKSNRRHYEAMEPIRSVENYFSLIDISAIGNVQSVYVEVNVELERTDQYVLLYDRWEVWKHGIWCLCYAGNSE